jgi:hypothetical protein
LVYPELFPKTCLFSSEAELEEKLKSTLLTSPQDFVRLKAKAQVNFQPFDWNFLKPEYVKLLI